MLSERHEGKRARNLDRHKLDLIDANAHHGRIKAPINGRCRGVATRYMPAYLGWNRAMLREGFTGPALLDLALIIANS